MENINYKYLAYMPDIKEWNEKYKDLNLKIHDITNKRYGYSSHNAFPDLVFETVNNGCFYANLFPFNCGIIVLNNLKYNVDVRYYEAIIEFLRICKYSLVMLSFKKKDIEKYSFFLDKLEFKQIEQCSFLNIRSENNIVVYSKILK